MGEVAHEGRLRVAITFDDAYQGAVTYGIAAVTEAGLAATVFVSPSFLDGRGFWWDALVGDDGQLREEDRADALCKGRGLDVEVRARAQDQGKVLVVPDVHARGATEVSLGEVARLPGITLGAHTWSHPNLTRLTQAELMPEMKRPLAWLRDRYASTRPWLSYPYGLSSPTIESAAAMAGYTAGLCVTGGHMKVAPGNLFALPRLNVPAGLSAKGLELRLSGFFGE